MCFCCSDIRSEEKQHNSLKSRSMCLFFSLKNITWLISSFFENLPIFSIALRMLSPQDIILESTQTEGNNECVIVRRKKRNWQKTQILFPLFFFLLPPSCSFKRLRFASTSSFVFPILKKKKKKKKKNIEKKVKKVQLAFSKEKYFLMQCQILHKSKVVKQY